MNLSGSVSTHTSETLGYGVNYMTMVGIWHGGQLLERNHLADQCASYAWYYDERDRWKVKRAFARHYQTLSGVIKTRC